MTAPLFDVKAKFSEYVTRAENGEVIEITKHGAATAVIISLKEYESLKNERSAVSFMDKVYQWRQRAGKIFDDEYALAVAASRSKDSEEGQKNPWV